MDCLDDNTLAALSEAVLSDEERERAERHLDHCDRCRRVSSGFGRLYPADDAAEGDTAPAASVLEPGSRVDRYVVLYLHGRGGMGDVYAAYDPELDRKVALKLVRGAPAAAGAAQAAQAILAREAKALARLEHPNVVGVHELGTFGDRLFLAMQFVEGQNLAQWLAEAPRATREIVTLFKKAGEGLAAAHLVGLVHGDVKPDNILVGADGRVCVSDFGLAVEAASPAARTEAYLAPEQRDGARGDARSDQYSFCLAMQRALGDGARPVPWPIRRALARGLSPRPEDRYPSFDALLSDFRRRPSRALRLAAGAVGATLVGLAAVAAIVAAVRSTRDPRCQLVSADRDRLIGPAARAKLSAALGRASSETSSDAQSIVLGRLRGKADAWAKERQQACRVSAVGSASRVALELRMECLDEQWHQLDELVTTLAGGDERVVLRAEEAAAALPDAQRCADTRALAVTPVAGTETAAQRAQLRNRLAAMRSIAGLGQYERAEKEARAIAESARSLEDLPVEAEALTALGKVQEWRGEIALAQATDLRAIAAAEASHHLRVLAEAWNSLAWVQGVRQAKYAEAHQSAELAEAEVEAAGGDPRQRADQLDTLANVLRAEGKPQQALEALDRALALDANGALAAQAKLDLLGTRGILLMELDRLPEALEILSRVAVEEERVDGPWHPWVGKALTNLCVAQWKLRRLADAQTSCERAYQIKRRALGEQSEDTVAALANLASLRVEAGEYDAAVQMYSEAIDATTKARGPDHPNIGSMLTSLGDALRLAHHLDASAEALQRALALREKALGPNHPLVASTLIGLGRTQLAQGQPQAAIGSFERAAAIAPASLPALLGLADAVSSRDRRRALSVLTRASALVRAHPSPDPGQGAELEFLTGRTMGRDAPKAEERVRKALEVWTTAGPEWKDRALEAQRWLHRDLSASR